MRTKHLHIDPSGLQITASAMVPKFPEFLCHNFRNLQPGSAFPPPESACALDHHGERLELHGVHPSSTTARAIAARVEGAISGT
jgi:hypothetical protein